MTQRVAVVMVVLAVAFGVRLPEERWRGRHVGVRRGRRRGRRGRAELRGARSLRERRGGGAPRHDRERGHRGSRKEAEPAG